jgi:hypothetical protein
MLQEPSVCFLWRRSPECDDPVKQAFANWVIAGERMLGLTIGTARRGLFASLAGIAIGSIAFAQDSALPSMAGTTLTANGPSPGISVTPAPNAAAVPPTAVPPGQLLTQGQLAQLVAPIALYPDPLLAQILMASTYPLEVVEAARWVAAPANRGLTSDALANALQAQNWDPSVKALVPFPRVLENMNNQLQWTEELGNAFLAQQADIMAMVQTLRRDAMAAGNLTQTPQCRCVIHTSAETISILPAAPQAVCVPVYRPVAYGAWPYPAYPPGYFPIPVGFAFAAGFWIGYEPPILLASVGPLWGWGWIDWGHRYIAVDTGRYALANGGAAAFSGSVWVHNPAHRGGIAYAEAGTRARFDAARVSAVTMAARSGDARGATAAGRSVGGRGFGSAGSQVFRGGAGRFGAAAVSHGGTALRGEAVVRGSPTFHDASPLHGGAAVHGAAAHSVAAVHDGGPRSNGAPHLAMAGPHGGGGPRGGGIRRGGAAHFAVIGPHGGGAPHAGGAPHGGGARGGGPHEGGGGGPGGHHG